MSSQQELYLFISGNSSDVKEALKFICQRYQIVSQSIHPSPITPGVERGYVSIIRPKDDLGNPF